MARQSLVAAPPVDPAQLGAAERDCLVDELFDVHSTIFDGIDRPTFRRYVVEPRDVRTRIQVLREAGGKVGGYVAIHSGIRTIDGRSTLVVRSEVGLLRKWRGGTPQARFVLTECLRLCLRHWWRPKVVFACPIHPSSFWGVTRRAPRSWPRLDRPTPPAMHRALLELAESFGLPIVDPARPLVRRVGWITRQSAADDEFWRLHRAPLVNFYREQNPTYAQGTGLLMLVPLDLRLIAVGGWRQLLHRLRRTRRSARLA